MASHYTLIFLTENITGQASMPDCLVGKVWSRTALSEVRLSLSIYPSFKSSAVTGIGSQFTLDAVKPGEERRIKKIIDLSN